MDPIIASSKNEKIYRFHAYSSKIERERIIDVRSLASSEAGTKKERSDRDDITFVLIFY
jgi:hypothetical protein